MTPAAVLDRRHTDERLALWTDEPPVDAAPVAAPRPARSDVVQDGHGAGRLSDALDGAWSALEAGFATACLLCGGAMRPRWSAGAGVVGGRCADCGTDLE